MSPHRTRRSEAAGNNDSNEVSNSVECRGAELLPTSRSRRRPTPTGSSTRADSFLYTITVTNVGEVQATGVELIDELPPGAALSISISPFPTFDGTPCVIASSIPPGGTAQATVHCGPIALGPGESASVTFKVTVTGDDCGPITNIVDVEGTNEPAANVGPDNHAEASDEIACDAADQAPEGRPDARARRRHRDLHLLRDQHRRHRPDGHRAHGPRVRHDSRSARTTGTATPSSPWTRAGRSRVTTRSSTADGDPVHNQATVTGDHDGGTVSDTDTHDIDVIHPDIDLEKSASPDVGYRPGPPSSTPTPSRTQATRPLFNISVDDDMIGHVGDIASLAAGQTSELTFEITLGSSPITNVATATGSDVLGASVSDVDEVTVSVVAGGGGGDGTGGGSPFTGSSTGTLSGWAAALALAGIAPAARSVPQASRDRQLATDAGNGRRVRSDRALDAIFPPSHVSVLRNPWASSTICLLRTDYSVRLERWGHSPDVSPGWRGYLSGQEDHGVRRRAWTGSIGQREKHRHQLGGGGWVPERTLGSSRRQTKRGLASFVSFVLLFAFALGQSSLSALADDAGTDPVAAEEVLSDGSTGEGTLPEEAPAEEAPAEEAPAEEAPAEEAPAAEADGDTSGTGAAATGAGDARKGQINVARVSRTTAIAAPAAPPGVGELDGGDIDLDYVAAGPFTYNHATGLGTHPQFGYDNRTISKSNGVVESLESGDFACGDFVTFFTEITVDSGAAAGGTIELDYTFGAETTGQPGLGFDDIIDVDVNKPDDGNKNLDGDEVATLIAEGFDSSGYDQVHRHRRDRRSRPRRRRHRSPDRGAHLHPG